MSLGTSPELLRPAVIVPTIAVGIGAAGGLMPGHQLFSSAKPQQVAGGAILTSAVAAGAGAFVGYMGAPHNPVIEARQMKVGAIAGALALIAFAGANAISYD